ncbi:MAG: phosphoribosylglycinamide formyltransferase [gamma proteobacterium symbiont of Bathyaustriella thionipta]|nr:phosphoribosylglycinamide formyltransferase [gamma proteobacterium symbiont of Bathyaustriella thionipta]
MLNLVVLVSGSGSNLQALMDACNQGMNARIVLVISDKGDAYGLERARQAGIATEVIPAADYDSRESFDQALQQRIDAAQAELVLLAGFMRILSAGFVNHYAGRLLNIHPSLLPKFRGLHTHQRALEAGEMEHGASVHFVTLELDGGPLIAQAKVAVQKDDDADTLAARVLQREHQLYPTVVRWFSEGRLCLRDEQVILDSKTLSEPVQLAE